MLIERPMPMPAVSECLILVEFGEIAQLFRMRRTMRRRVLLSMVHRMAQGEGRRLVLAPVAADTPLERYLMCQPELGAAAAHHAMLDLRAMLEEEGVEPSRIAVLASTRVLHAAEAIGFAAVRNPGQPLLVLRPGGGYEFTYEHAMMLLSETGRPGGAASFEEVLQADRRRGAAIAGRGLAPRRPCPLRAATAAGACA
ncbi:hypothetical protein LNKW23_16750 [Paralimibaculum aggregatum]|uniref:Uncharacterized protein n=2 Tax=Paralimibaculum aggregatum TaxID=3036245 RepID=A0ABQ6LLB2_9RHOB|nr:hypothetical protein LNKW23_16750 [Limibaculum sp. NKW23]